MSVLKYPARCEKQPWRNGGAAVHMSAADVRVRADEVRPSSFVDESTLR